MTGGKVHKSTTSALGVRGRPNRSTGQRNMRDLPGKPGTEGRQNLGTYQTHSDAPATACTQRAATVEVDGLAPSDQDVTPVPDTDHIAARAGPPLLIQQTSGSRIAQNGQAHGLVDTGIRGVE